MNPVINPVEALYIQVQFVATVLRIFIGYFAILIIHEIKHCQRVFREKLLNC